MLLFENAVPVFVDVDARTGNINPELVAEVARDLVTGGERASRRWLPRKGSGSDSGVSRRLPPKAILPVDVFCQPADLDPIHKVAQEYGLKVIEDSCEDLGERGLALPFSGVTTEAQVEQVC